MHARRLAGKLSITIVIEISTTVYSASGEHAKGVVATEYERFPIPPQLPRPPAEDLAAAAVARELLRLPLVIMMPESSRRRERRVEAAEDEEADGEVQPSC